MQQDFAVIILGGNADGLALAARLTKSGRQVAVLETGMKAGGDLLTESFLTYHRFNLSGGWLIGEHLAAAEAAVFNDGNGRLLLPEVPFAFLFADREPLLLHRSFARSKEQVVRVDRVKFDRLFRLGEDLYDSLLGYFSGASKEFIARLPPSAAAWSRLTIRQMLDHYGFTDARLRCALTYLPLAFGHDIEATGSGAVMAYLLFGLTQLSLVDGGSGLIAAALADAIIAGGGMMIESAKISRIDAGATGSKRVVLQDGRVFSAPAIVMAQADCRVAGLPVRSSAADHELGIYRVYLGLAQNPGGFSGSGEAYQDVNRAYMVALGFEDEAAIYRYLRMTRIGQPPFIAGHVIANGHLDPVSQVGVLGQHGGQLWCTACHTRDVQELRGPFPDPSKGLTVQASEARRLQSGEKAGGATRGSQDKATAADRASAGAALLADRRVLRPATGALIWQGILPMHSRMIDPDGFRKSFEQACASYLLARLDGVAAEDVTFRLAWLPQETRESLQRADLPALLAAASPDDSYLTTQRGIYTNLHSRLSSFTGMATAQRLSVVLEHELALQAHEALS